MTKRSIIITVLFLLILPVFVLAQKLTITGKIMDKNGMPLVGVTVYDPVALVGAIADLSGDYSIDCEPGATLKYSMIGYVQQNVSVSGRTIIDITMEEEVLTLDELVVIGYGSAKKSDLTGSVVSIKGSDLKSPSLTNAMSALQGKVSGLRVNTEGGAPGTGSSISVRGIATFASDNAPLVIIDGLPGNGNNVNPADVQSIEILKDASACAIYGARGANGVIIITTNQGKAGESKFSFDAYYGWQNPAKKLDVLNSQEYSEVLQASGMPLPPAFNQDSVNYYSTLNDYNWQDEIFATAPVQNYHLSAMGGSEKVKYMISGTLYDQKGVIAPSAFTKYSLRTNLEASLSDKFSVIFNMDANRSNTKSILGGAGPRYGGVLGNALAYPPFLPIYNSVGNYLRNPLRNDSDNPLAAAFGRDMWGISNNIFTKLNLVYKITNDLTFRINNGVGYSNDFNHSFNSPTKTERGRNSGGAIDNGSYNSFNLINEDYLTYVKTIGKSSFTALAAFTVESNDRKGIYLSGTGFADDLIQNLSGVSSISSWGSSLSKDGMVSYLGRIIYDYNSKLLFTGSIRSDGSSKFGPDRKYGNFPSFSAAYKVINASNDPYLSQLKIRAGWGVLGNSSIGNFRYIPMVAANTLYSFDGTNLSKGYSMNNLGQKNLHWEETRQVNAAVDLGFFKNRLMLSADFYVKNTHDCLYDLQLPFSSGSVNTITTNFAEIQNKGIEFQVHSNNVSTNSISWTSDISYSINNNKVINNGHQNVINGNFILQEGLPRFAYWGYVTEGIFQNQTEIDAHASQPGAAPGDIKFKDVAGLNSNLPDGTIDQNDKVYLGSPIPKVTYGFANTVSAYGFDLYVLIEGVSGNKIANINNMDLLSMRDSYNGLSVTKNHWTTEGQVTDMPRAIFSDPNGNSTKFSTRFVEDGSYLRARTITLGYTLPPAASRFVRVEKLRIYGNIQNALTISDYSGFDPEVGIEDSGVYPAIKTFSLGINLTF